jgi:hypothetical protein
MSRGLGVAIVRSWNTQGSDQCEIERMKTQRLMMAVMVAVALAGVAVVVSGCKEKSSIQNSGQAVKYTCSMHPDVVQDKPGSCPKCGMALVEKR